MNMANELEEIFDRCIEEARSGRDPEAILRAQPEAVAEVRPLLALAVEMAALPAPPPSEASLAKLFAHLAKDAAQRELRPPTDAVQQELRPPADAAPAGPAPARARRRWLGLRALGWAAAAVFLVFLAGWSMVSASAAALPGDLLYPIKLLTERAAYFLTIGSENRVELRIQFADKRLKEAVRAHRRGGGIDTQLLRAMLDEAILALDAADRLPEASRNLVMQRAACSCQYRCRMLSSLLRRASPQERNALTPYMEACMAGCMCRGQGHDSECCESPAEVAVRMRSALPAAPQP